MKPLLTFFISLIALAVSAQAPIIDFITPDIVRVRWTPDGTLTDNATGVCIYPQTIVDMEETQSGSLTIYRSDSLEVTVDSR